MYIVHYGHYYTLPYFVLYTPCKYIHTYLYMLRNSIKNFLEHPDRFSVQVRVPLGTSYPEFPGIRSPPGYALLMTTDCLLPGRDILNKCPFIALLHKHINI